MIGSYWLAALSQAEQTSVASCLVLLVLLMRSIQSPFRRVQQIMNQLVVHRVSSDIRSVDLNKVLGSVVSSKSVSAGECNVV